MTARLNQNKMVQLTIIVATEPKAIGEDSQMEEKNQHAFALWA